MKFFPWLKNCNYIKFVKGDIRNFKFLKEKISYFIHGVLLATYTQIEPLELLDIGINGTKRVLEFAKYCEAEKFLFISFGVIYGKQLF